ncbi:MAG: M6 family metalloprotease domain-containing protein [Thermoplasmata archaeon]|nr:MAG: M6 family metalloprotease domain-containing protein [Thermoplasmata archaeon]
MRFGIGNGGTLRRIIKKGNLGNIILLFVLSLMVIGFLGSIVVDVEEDNIPMENNGLDISSRWKDSPTYEMLSNGYITYPPDPTPYFLKQPDGTEFEARNVGERIGGHVETMDGYTIIQDERGWWTYAKKDYRGVLVPTNDKVCKIEPESILGLRKHLSNDYPEVEKEDRNRLHHSTRAPPTNTTWKAIAIMLNFTDEDFDSGNNISHFQQMLNGTTGNTMRTYYREVSYGQFDIEVDVFGPFQSNRTMAYYGDNNPPGRDNANGSISNMAKEAVQLADPTVDFSPYDLDSDGTVDALFIIHAGSGEEQSSNEYDIWSHMSSAWYNTNDGVWTGPYSTEPEDGKIGVFCHEFGHILRLPDLYDTDYSSKGIGQWGVMAGGSWNGGGNTPAHFSAWPKIRLGWVEPRIVTSDLSLFQIEIPPVENNTVIYKIWAHDPSENTDEYFLVENRQKIGYDSALPGDGILIWHIDESQSNNNDETHYLVDLEEADGDQELETSSGISESTDPWKNTVMGFRNTTNPNSSSYNGSDTHVWVWNISAIDPVSKNMSVGFNEIYSGPTGIFISDPVSNTTIPPMYNFVISDIEFPDEDIGSDNDGNNGSFVLESKRNNTLNPWNATPSQSQMSWVGGVAGVINCTALPGGFWDFRVKILDEEGHLLYTPYIWNITIPENNPPVADAGEDNLTDVNEITVLDGSGSYDDSGYIIWYNWTFGDGTFQNGSDPVVTHIYNETGTYTVILNVTDSFGNWDNDTVNITVEDLGAPTTTLNIGDPKYRENVQDHYNVTSITPFSLTAVDNYSGVNFTWYKIDGVYFVGNDFTLMGYDEGMHNLSWGSVDNVGNNETGNYETVILDDTPPDTALSIGSPKHRKSGSDILNVTDTTIFTLSPTDQYSGVDYTWYTIEGDYYEGTSFNLSGYLEGLITILYSSVDNLGNFQISNIIVNLDTSKPITTLTIGAPKYREFGTDNWNVTTSTDFSLTHNYDGMGSGINFTWYTIDSTFYIYSTPFTLTPGIHTIIWGSEDNLTLNETGNSIEVYVDITPPITTLFVGNPKNSSSPMYINSSTGFDLTATDDPGSGVAGIWYRIDSGAWTLYSGQFTISISGAHTLYYNSTDNLGQSETIMSFEIFVDNDPPETTPSAGNPNYGSQPTFINLNTYLNLTATDGLGSGVDSIWYKIDSGNWSLYSGEFNMSTPGAHMVFFNSTDNLGQVETTKSYEVYVDINPPTSIITIKDPNYGFSPTFVNSSTYINLSATDGLGSGVFGIRYKIDWNGIWGPYVGEFTISTPGLHTIHYYSTDNLGLDEVVKTFDVFVDDSPPVSTLTMGDPKIGSSPTYINSSTEFNLTATDGTGSGLATIWYRIDSGSWVQYVSNFTISTSGDHTLYYKSTDNLGQDENQKSIDVYVDITPPQTTVNVGDPKYSSSPTYVDSGTNFNLTATDGTGSGVASIWYKIDSGIWTLYAGNFTISTLGAHTIYYNATDILGRDEITKSFELFVDDAPPETTLTLGNPKFGSSPPYINSSTDITLMANDASGSGVATIWYKIDTGIWTPYSGDFNVQASGAHTVYYYSTDNLGHEEIIKSYNIIVDNAPPETTITMGNPRYSSSPTYVNSSTDFNLTATDGTGSGLATIWYKIDSGSWTQYISDFTVSTSGAHTLYYKSTDNLGQDEDTKTMDIYVDITPPETTISVGDPQYSSSPKYVTSSTEFNLTATDGMGSGVAYIWYKIDTGNFITYNGNFTVSTSGAHNITYYSTDNLQRDEPTKIYYIIVDNSPPTTNLSVGVPKFRETDLDPWNVTKETDFILNPIDDFSGVKITWYTIDGEYFEALNFNLLGHEEGPHMITWGSLDNLGNNETNPPMIVILQASSPTTNLSIGMPIYRGLPTDFWNVTSTSTFTLTPLSSIGIIDFIWYTIDGEYFEGDTFNLSGYDDEPHSITWGSQDKLGHNETGNFIIVLLDNTEPTSSIDFEEPTYPHNPIFNVTGYTPINLSSTDNTGCGVESIYYRIFRDSNLVLDWTEYIQGTIFFNLSDYDDGFFTIAFNATDHLGNVELSKLYYLYLDNTPPSTNIDFDNPRYRNGDVGYWNVTSKTQFSLNASDSQSKVNFTWFKIDSDYFVGSSFNLSGYDDDMYTISWGSIDNLGNQEAEKTINVILDNSPPDTNLDIGTPKYHESLDDIWNVTEDTSFTLTSLDQHSGVSVIWYKIDEVYFEGSNFDLSGLDDGLHTITWGSIDNLGNEEPERTISVILDTSPPSTELVIGTPKYRENDNDNWNVIESTEFTLISTDQYSGVDLTWYTIDDDYFEGLTFDFEGYSDGLYTITWVSLDNLGWNETPNTLFINLDNTPPSVSIDIGWPNVTVDNVTHITSTTPITLNSFDSGVNGTTVFYSIDGGATYSMYESPFTVSSTTTAIIYGGEDALGNRGEESSFYMVVDNSDTDEDGTYDLNDKDDDNDGLSDEEEITLGTDPLNTDTDGDGRDDLNDKYPTDKDKWRDPTDWEKLPIVGGYEQSFCFNFLIIFVILIIILVVILKQYKKWRARSSWKEGPDGKSGNK